MLLLLLLLLRPVNHPHIPTTAGEEQQCLCLLPAVAQWEESTKAAATTIALMDTAVYAQNKEDVCAQMWMQNLKTPGIDHGTQRALSACSSQLTTRSDIVRMLFSACCRERASRAYKRCGALRNTR